MITRADMINALITLLMQETCLSREDARAQIEEVTDQQTDLQIAARFAPDTVPLGDIV